MQNKPMPVKLRKRRAARKGVPFKPGADSLLPKPPDGYEACKGEIAIRMGHFFVRHFIRLYHEFDGDLALIIVLGEIGHHNASQFYSAKGPVTGSALSQWARSGLWTQLTPCNAFSLIAATGIPRETVRRKIAWLIKRGWVKRNAKGEVCILPAVSQHFTTDFNVRTLCELLELSDQLRTMLSARNGMNRPATASTHRSTCPQ